MVPMPLGANNNYMKRSAAIFATGLVLRLAAVGYLSRAAPHMLSWGANEAGGIARWIVTNQTFSSPFHDAHGPTAWIAPAYPGIIACIFLVFGVQTPLSAVAVMCFNSLCSAATGVIVYEIGKEAYGEKAGWVAGWMWALSPYAAILPYILWDTALSALVLSVAVWLTLRLARSSKAGNWIICGATWGLAALVNPTLLTPLPVLALWLWDRGTKWRQVLMMSLATCLIIAPWTIRNYLVFREVVPIRSNGVAEIYFANCGFETHPLGPSMEYQALGEAAFTSQAGRRAIECVRSHPVTFLENSLRRVALFWVYPVNFWPLSFMVDLGALAGMMLVFKKSGRVAAPLIAVLAIYPLVYYVSQVVSRYRHPIDPILYALCGVALCRYFRPDSLSRLKHTISLL